MKIISYVSDFNHAINNMLINTCVESNGHFQIHGLLSFIVTYTKCKKIPIIWYKTIFCAIYCYYLDISAKYVLKWYSLNIWKIDQYENSIIVICNFSVPQCIKNYFIALGRKNRGKSLKIMKHPRIQYDYLNVSSWYPFF